MLLQDALDELRGSILRDVSTKKIGPDDQYWSDTALVGYINEAQRRFARRTFCLRDSINPEVTQFTIAKAIDQYTLHPKIVFVQGVRLLGDPMDLTRITHNVSWIPSDNQSDVFSTVVVDRPNRPIAFSTDEGIDLDNDHAIILKLYPTPDDTTDGAICTLRVSRLPLNDLTLKDLKAPLEISDDYAYDMLEWAAWRALRNWDIDAEDRNKAKQHRDRFDEAVKECRREILHKIFQPVKWRFGEGGFSYTRR
jgi:hypothetical protein